MISKVKITVIGSGLMGHGIALVFARSGHHVIVQDPEAKALASLHDRVRESLVNLGVEENSIPSILACIQTELSLDAAVANADFVIEAAPENLSLKKTLFAQIEQAAPAHCVLASNTSVIPITSIMEDLNTKERAVGTHWWNPPHMIPLVEVIRTQWSTDETVESTFQLLAACGKSPVRVEKDVPGFIGNRLQHALWREAISLVENGICTAEDVDLVVKQSFGRRLAVLGPMENADLVGTDLTQAIHEQVLHDLERSPEPSPLLNSLVESGKLGMKTGEGFQTWSPTDAQATAKRVSKHLLKLETILE
jgi:3-hydroxybutyryl-CoA dehydrogenase